MTRWQDRRLAVWALTPRAAQLALRLKKAWTRAELFFPESLDITAESKRFKRFSQGVRKVFTQYDGHFFIMAAGIVVRAISGLLKDKTTDPAVVVGDEAGSFVISLVSGHLGGANDLARQLAAVLDAQPVVTTATDVSHVPAIDVIARDQGLYIENPGAIKHVTMAYLKGLFLPLHDPYQLVRPHLPEDLAGDFARFSAGRAGVFVDYRVRVLPEQVLVLRPRCLVAGIGCRRNVDEKDLESFVRQVFEAHGLSIHSLGRIVSADIKANEPGLRRLAEKLNVATAFYSTEELNRVKMVPNPSLRVEKHIGVKSVCEAAVILATGENRLIVEKQAGKTATIAIGKMPFTS